MEVILQAILYEKLCLLTILFIDFFIINYNLVHQKGHKPRLLAVFAGPDQGWGRAVAFDCDHRDTVTSVSDY